MIYALVLNDMRAPNIENVQVVRTSTERQELVDFYLGEVVKPWLDEGKVVVTDTGVTHRGAWRKSFRKGGPLEWFNPMLDDITDESRDGDYWGGIWQVADGTPVGEALVKGAR